MSLPDNPPPQYSQSHSVPPKRSYGTAAEEPLLANHQASQDAWIHSSQNELADDEGDGVKDERNVTDCELEIRMGFVRKVYSILLVQLVSTTVIAAFLHLSSTATQVMHKTPLLMLIPLIGTFLTLIGVTYRRHVYPSNLILLGAFTVCESFLIGMATSYMESRILLQALVLTSGVFIGLTLFTFQTKYDFSSLGPFLFAGLWGLLGVGLVQIFLPFNKTFDLAVSAIGVLVFSGYVLYDTQNIMKRLSPDEYIFGALSLYLDFINLFLYILRILNNQQRN